MKFVCASDKIELNVDEVELKLGWLSTHQFDSLVNVIPNYGNRILEVLDVLAVL